MHIQLHDSNSHVNNGKSALPVPRPERIASARILVPIRLEMMRNDALTAILETAARLHAGAQVTLLHVLPQLPADGPSYHWLDAIERLHQRAADRDIRPLENTRRILADHVASNICEKLRSDLILCADCRVGDAAKEIANYANVHAIDLVILSKEPRAWRWPLKASLTDRILSLTDKPVLVMRPTKTTLPAPVHQ